MRFAFAAPLALSFALLPAKEQDLLTLKSGDVFAGEVLALEDGLIELQSPHSSKPLKIINEGLVQLSFATQSSDSETNNPLPRDSQEIILKNGDRFPGELVFLDQDQITFKTWFTGDLNIPRSQIESILFGVTPQETVYRGPTSLDQWDQENTRNWSFQNDSLVARQRSSIGREFNLPGNFIFRSKVAWENSPNCRIFLAASETNFESAGDSYLITLGSGGVRLQRVSLDKKGNTSFEQLANNSVSLRSRGTKSVDLEVHVDRERRMIHLFLDGEKVAQASDPGIPPGGDCVVFESQNHSNGDMTVSQISIDEWDTKTRALRLEPRAAADLDTLSVKDGDRFSGQIISFDPADSNQSFSVKTTLSPDPIIIPLPHCSVVYFAEGEDLVESTGRYKINLRVGGSLTVSKITLGPDTLIAIHPWLGELQLDRRAMQSITKG